MARINMQVTEHKTPFNEAGSGADASRTVAADPRIAVVIVAGASIFELVAASLACGATCSGLQTYAITVGAISGALVVPFVLVYFAEPLAPPQFGDALPHLALLLLVWWLPAAFLLTFVTPFAGLSNGYFATLVAAAYAIQNCMAHVPLVDSALRDAHAVARAAPRERTLLVMLAATSTAMWVQAAICASMYADATATKAWAIIVGVVSSVLCTFYLLLENLSLHQTGFALLVAAWWLQGVCISFVPSSFIGSMNGFISTWASVFLAFYFLRTVRSPHDLLPTAPPDEEGLGGPTTDYHEAPEEGVPLPDAPTRLGPSEPQAFRHTPA